MVGKSVAGLRYLHDVFLPYLKNNGVTEKEILRLTYDNPREALLITKQN